MEVGRMEEKIYLKEKDYAMPTKKISTTGLGCLNEEELEQYLRSIEVLKPWEVIEINRDAVVGAPAFVITKIDATKIPKGAEVNKDRAGTFFNIIQYKFSCDIKNGKFGKNSLANFTTFVKGVYSFSYPAFVLEKLKKINKDQAKIYAAAYKAELQKLYEKKIAQDKKELEKYKLEVAGTVAESKIALAKIKV